MSDKFSNDLSDAQLERLALLYEEMGEAQQVIGKIIRHGYHSWNPTVVGIRTNEEELELEMGHVTCAFGLLADAGDIDRMTALSHSIKKKESVKKWMHHQEFAPAAPDVTPGLAEQHEWMPPEEDACCSCGWHCDGVNDDQCRKHHAEHVRSLRPAETPSLSRGER
jgi:hypothetical protein